MTLSRANIADLIRALEKAQNAAHLEYCGYCKYGTAGDWEKEKSEKCRDIKLWQILKQKLKSSLAEKTT